MEVIPALDLKEGRCVRLYQGDYAQETVFSEDPLSMACHWEGLGAPRLHIVDLDGAARGEPCHLALIEEMARSLRVPLQVGGGLRKLETLERLLNLGIDRAILGTAAVEDPQLVEEACRRFGERVLVSVDAREGYVATRAWGRTSRITATELMERMAALGVRRFIYTDIGRDGTLAGPNFEAIREVLSQIKLPLLASGGISSLEHLRRLWGLGVEGAIIGKALYLGAIDLKEALALEERRSHAP